MADSAVAGERSGAVAGDQDRGAQLGAGMPLSILRNQVPFDVDRAFT